MPRDGRVHTPAAALLASPVPGSRTCQNPEATGKTEPITLDRGQVSLVLGYSSWLLEGRVTNKMGWRNVLLSKAVSPKGPQ